jgi:hypothetical protein
MVRACRPIAKAYRGFPRFYRTGNPFGNKKPRLLCSWAFSFRYANSQFLPQGPGPHLVLDVVVVDRHGAVQQIAREPIPVVQAVVDGLGDRAAIGHALTLQAQPNMQFLAKRPGPDLPHGKALALPKDTSLDT